MTVSTRPPTDGRPLRVLVACSGLGGVSRGYETAAAKIAEELTKLPDAVTVTVARGGGPWTGGDGIRLPSLPRFGHLSREWLGLEGEAAYVWEQRSFAPAAYLLARLGRFDIVHLHDPALMNVYWHARRRLGGRFAIVFTNSGPIGPEHLTRPDLVQSVTPVDPVLSPEASLSGARVMVPYGVDPSSPTGREFVEGRPLRLIGVGALNDSHKGFFTAVRAVSELSDTSLRLVGQRDRETEALEALGRELLGPRFSTDTLPRERVSQALSEADVFVLPSHGEGFCIAVLEALEAGLPCVVSDIPVLRWLVGDAAVLVPPDQPHAWRAALAALDAGRRRELSAKARARARAFHWPALMPQYLEMYRQAISRPIGTS